MKIYLYIIYFNEISNTSNTFNIGNMLTLQKWRLSIHRDS